LQDSVKLGTIDLSAYFVSHPDIYKRARRNITQALTFFGRPPDVIVTENESMWHVTDTGWIYVVGDTNHAGKTLLTLLVDNLEDLVAELGERGLAPGAIDTVPGLYRKAVITDPEGNMISLGEDLSSAV
jgi:hypothetical protein